MYKLFCFFGLHHWVMVDIIRGRETLQECSWCGAGRVGMWFTALYLPPLWDWFDGMWELRDFHLQHPEVPWLHDKKGGRTK